MKVPGVVWVIAIVMIPLLAEWLTTFFGGSAWAAPVAALLTIAGVGIAKWVELSKGAPNVPDGVMLDSAPRAEPPGKARRWLLG